ncbi:hypothetical protein [Bacillus xiapuensis]|uniref:hypothetical protein n=1 Tax=Bacillus xiapuensis TaxID=2014075 RepID=UPI0012FDAAF9|nr:hypothetical protein [Bacillus xiapuensis]
MGVLKNISFSGAVYYEKNGQIKHYYYGYQDLEKKQPLKQFEAQGQTYDCEK